MLYYTGKWLPVTNTVAYFASSTVMKEKGFITLTPDVDLGLTEGINFLPHWFPFGSITFALMDFVPKMLTSMNTQLNKKCTVTHGVHIYTDNI